MYKNIKINQLKSIYTERLKIRLIKETDVTFIYKLRSNKNNAQFVEMKPYESIKRAQKFINHVTEDIKKGEVFFWILELKNTGEAIGTICLWSFSKDRESAEVGYELMKSFQRKGYAYEALKAIIDFANKSLSLKNLDAITNENHKASINLLLKNNFKSIGYVNQVIPEAEDGPEMKLFRKKL